LFREDGKIPLKDLNNPQYIDNPSRGEAGYYFAMARPNYLREGRARVLGNLKHSREHGSILEHKGECLEWIEGGVRVYEEWVYKLLKLLCVLIILTSRQAGRGTEMTSLLYRNSMEGDRNVMVEDGR